MTVRAAPRGHGRQDALDVVESPAPELVTDACPHTEGPASPRLTGLGGGRLRAGVWDSDPYVPSPSGRAGDDSAPLAPLDAGSGRGLLLVQEYADSWGGRALGDGALGRGAGKLLWFEVGGRATLPLLPK
ncbi:ATP-binding protein [Streptomyces sp. NPDC014344]|uniref:ATP-binding protein n=1 Tax=Streptomyces sp. NPDC014344 TaxID=3364871 RepID=UPI00370046A5